jgi:predicted transcriptional regulator
MDDFENRVLFLSESEIDSELAVALNNSSGLNGDLVDIQTSEDLNTLFITEDYFHTYSKILMILNHLSNPFNDTLVSQLDEYIQAGGIFGVISAHIWQFTENFHDLIGLSISTGQKIWPTGNSTEEITFTVYNDTFTRSPYEFTQNSQFTMTAEIGIAYPTEDSYQIIISENTPIGNTTMNTFQIGSGFVIAAPISPVNTISDSFTNFLTSVILSSVNMVEEQTTTSVTSNSSTIPSLRPLLGISEEVMQTSVVIISGSVLLIGFAYFIGKWRDIRPSDQIPKDLSILQSILLAPIILIGKVVYPPIIRRIDSYDVLENETRRKIIANLEDRDFLHFRELKRELGNIGTSGLKWHLQVLEDFEIIKRQVFGQYEIFHLRNTPPEYEFLELYFAIKSGLGYRVAKAFNQEMPSWDLTSLTEYLGSSKESIRYHCKKFELLKILRRENGRYFLNLQKDYLLRKAIIRRQKIN